MCRKTAHHVFPKNIFLKTNAPLGCKKTLHMEQALNATAGTFELIALNICTQILAFQESITRRASDAQFPTMQETGMLVKLVNCLDKLRKLAAPFKAATTFNNFFKFLAAEDKDLAALVKARYKAFTEQNNTTGTVMETNSIGSQNPSAISPAERTSPEVIEPENLRNNRGLNEYEILMRSAPNPPAYSADPPFSEDNFEKHKSLLPNDGVEWNHTVRINGQNRNACWVQYNLFQFLLPPGDRRFFHNENNYMKFFNYIETRKAITRSCRQNGIKKIG